MNSENTTFISTPAAILVGAVIISISVLIHGGIIKLKGLSPNRTTGTTETAGVLTLKDKLVNLASEMDMDKDKFSSCMDEGKYKEELSKDMADAQTAGVQGTPGFIIGRSTQDGKVTGIRIAGAYPLEVFNVVIEKLLSNTPLEQIPDLVVSEAYADVPEDQKASIKEGLAPNATALVDDDPVLGDKNAQVTIVEFSDYECPFCQRHFTQTYPKLRSQYIDSGKVKLVYRDYIAVPSHNPVAETEALAANCAREQKGDEGYFKYHDEIFTKTQANGVGI